MGIKIGSQTKYWVAGGYGKRHFLLNNNFSSGSLDSFRIRLKFSTYFLLLPTAWMKGTVRFGIDSISKIYLCKCHLKKNPVFPEQEN